MLLCSIHMSKIFKDLEETLLYQTLFDLYPAVTINIKALSLTIVAWSSSFNVCVFTVNYECLWYQCENWMTPNHWMSYPVINWHSLHPKSTAVSNPILPFRQDLIEKGGKKLNIITSVVKGFTLQSSALSNHLQSIIQFVFSKNVSLQTIINPASQTISFMDEFLHNYEAESSAQLCLFGRSNILSRREMVVNSCRCQKKKDCLVFAKSRTRLWIQGRERMDCSPENLQGTESLCKLFAIQTPK